jgi:hypothetical protein
VDATARTRMGGLYCIRLCTQVEVRNLYAYAVVAPLVESIVDMITIVSQMKSFKTLSHVTPSIRET